VSAASTKDLASRAASGTLRPSARPAQIAADNEHPGAVIVRGRHALSVKDKDFTVTDQDVGGAALGERALREMAPFDEDPGRTEAQELVGRARACRRGSSRH